MRLTDYLTQVPVYEAQELGDTDKFIDFSCLGAADSLGTLPVTTSLSRERERTHQLFVFVDMVP